MQQVRAALARVWVTSPTAFVWHGERLTLAPESLDGLEAEEIRRLLVARLEHHLYEGFYLTGGRIGAPVPRRSAPWLSGFSAELASSNRGRGRLEPGWRVLRRGGEQVTVERDGLRVDAAPDEIEDGGAGDLVRLRAPVDLPCAFPGFHTARGEWPERDESLGVDRLYWNLRPEGAAALVRLVSTRLNVARVPFGLKIVGDPRAFGRTDAAVLIVGRPDRPAVVLVLRSVLAALADDLDPPTPAFTKRLAPGLGFADAPPGGESFGTSRCRLLAEALIDAQERGLIGDDERLDAVRRRFGDAGLDLDRPHLGAGAGIESDLDLGLPRRPPALRRRSAPDVLGVARGLGRRLCETALWDGDCCTWIAERADDPAESGTGVRLTDLGPTLHDGTAGVALFLAELARLTGDSAARDASLGASRQALARRAAVPPAARSGLFGGWVGIALVATHAGLELGCPELVDGAAGLTRGLGDPGVSDAFEDRAEGTLGLLTLWEMTGDGELLARARGQADALARELTRITGQADTGLSPRAARAAHAVSEVTRAVDDPRLTAAADQIAAAASPRIHLEGSWDAGPAGIAVALRGPAAQAALDDLCADLADLVAERHADLSLGVGLVGAADTLLRVADHHPSRRAELLALAAEVADLVVLTSRRPSGFADEPPGLMLGLAGIGLGCLRLHDPRVVSPLGLPSSWMGEGTVASPVRRPA